MPLPTLTKVFQGLGASGALGKTAEQWGDKEGLKPRSGKIIGPGGQAVHRWQGGWSSWGQGRDLRAMLGLVLGLEPQHLSVRH